MSPKEWFTQGSPKTVGAALATAIVAGLGAGAWLELPSYLAEPIHNGAPQPITADDPGRERWDQVVASLGGLGATFVVPAAFYRDTTPEAEFAPDLSDQMAAATAEIDQQLRESEARAQMMRMAWMEPPARRYAYEPVRYAEPPTDAPPVYARGYEPAEPAPIGPAPVAEAERPTSGFEEPAPPPPPRPSDGW